MPAATSRLGEAAAAAVAGPFFRRRGLAGGAALAGTNFLKSASTNMWWIATACNSCTTGKTARGSGSGERPGQPLPSAL